MSETVLGPRMRATSGTDGLSQLGDLIASGGRNERRNQ